MEPFQHFPAETRVWIYQSNQPIPEETAAALKQVVNQFAQNWVSHNRQLRAHGDVLHNRFILLAVDESQADASGCSIDKSVHFIKQVESQLGVDLFDRMNFAWMEDDEVKTAPSQTFAELYQSGQITNETLVFDNLVKTKRELEENWLKPLNKSWHRRFV
ncbi:MAG: hypothetical protein IPN76_10640 [Saprospiraceae bacterium]|jgi:hypothetical protein|nr:hypothetical protein [Saprospiraceae bacterium]